MVFSSKKDLWMAIPIWAFIIVFVRMLYKAITQGSMIGIVIAIILISFVGAIWFYTRYTIENELLIINFGCIKKTLNIRDIRSIRKTTNPFASPSLSIHKIEISYDKYETIQIAPKDMNIFIDELQKRNADIQVKNS